MRLILAFLAIAVFTVATLNSATPVPWKPYIYLFMNKHCGHCEELVDYFTQSGFDFLTCDTAVNRTHLLRFELLSACGFPMVYPTSVVLLEGNITAFVMGDVENDTFWEYVFSLRPGQEIPVFLGWSRVGTARVRNYTLLMAAIFPEYASAVLENATIKALSNSELEALIQEIKNGTVEEPITVEWIQGGDGGGEGGGGGTPTPRPDVLSLILLAIPLALMDSINPCMLTLYSLALLSSPRREAAKWGSSFALAVFSAYLAIGLGLLAVATFMPLWIVGVIAVVAGAYTIISSLRSGIACREGRRLSAVSKLFERGSVLFAFAAGALVSITLLPCSAGPYLVFSAVVNSSGLPMTNKVLLLMLYDAIFVLPLLVILVVAVAFGRRIGSRFIEAGRWLDILAGGVLVVIGIVMIL